MPAGQSGSGAVLQRLYNQYIEHYKLAEEVGFDGIMLNEHHNAPFCMQAKWRLLEMITGAAPLLRKARDVELYDNDVHHRRAAASHWDRGVAPGHDAIPRPRLKAKHDELRSALSHVSRYANE